MHNETHLGTYSKYILAHYNSLLGNQAIHANLTIPHVQSQYVFVSKGLDNHPFRIFQMTVKLFAPSDVSTKNAHDCYCVGNKKLQ